MIQNQKLTDEQIAKIALTKPEYYELLVIRHERQLIRFLVKRFSLSNALAEDAVQETFIKAYLKLSQFDSDKKWKTWIYRIAINSAKTFLRQPRNEDIEEYPNICAEAILAEEDFDRQLQTRQLNLFLESLPQTDRAILRMRYLQEMSCSEISKQIKMPASVVRTRIDFALRRLTSEFIAN